MSALFEKLYAELHAPILNHLRHKVGDPDTAEDLAQDVWAKMAERLDEYAARPGFNPQALVYRAATNRAIDHLRRGRSAAAGGRVRFESLDAPAPAADATGLTDGRTAETGVLAAEAHAAAAGAAALSLELVPRRYRLALWLFEWRRYPYADAAALMGLTAGGFKTLLFRARDCQRRALAVARSSGGRGQRLPLVERFWSSVEGGRARADDRSGCWRWIGNCDTKYRKSGVLGVLWKPGPSVPGAPPSGARLLQGRRLAYVLVRGCLPPWARLKNTCGEPRCVSPWHVAVTAPHGPRLGSTLRVAPVEADAPESPPPDARAARARRERIGLTMDELAARAGVSRRCIGLLEAGELVLPTTAATVLGALERAEAEVAPPPSLEEITRRRLALGLSRNRLSVLISGKNDLVGGWERGHHRPFKRTLRRAGEVLDRLERERAEGVPA